MADKNSHLQPNPLKQSPQKHIIFNEKYRRTNKKTYFPALALIIIFGLGCAASKPTPGIIQITAGEEPESIPGPMPAFGSFDKASDAIQAACTFILNQPRAIAGRPTSQNFQLYWVLSQEYCAWLYYTPDHKYELSMLATKTVQDSSNKRICTLPPVVEDPRYPSASLGYLFALHNHPYESEPSDNDIRFIIDMASRHGVSFPTGNGQVPISIVAFYSQSDVGPRRTCDGFFQYIPGTGELLNWFNNRGQWEEKLLGRVVWLNESKYSISRQ